MTTGRADTIADDRADADASGWRVALSPAWDQLDETARIAALELLARLIARVIADAPIKELGHE